MATSGSTCIVNQDSGCRAYEDRRRHSRILSISEPILTHCIMYRCVSFSFPITLFERKLYEIYAICKIIPNTRIVSLFCELLIHCFLPHLTPLLFNDFFGMGSWGKWRTHRPVYRGNVNVPLVQIKDFCSAILSSVS